MIKSVVPGTPGWESNLNTLIEDGYTLFAVIPGCGFNEEFWYEPYIVMHKPDESEYDNGSYYDDDGQYIGDDDYDDEAQNLFAPPDDMRDIPF